MQNFYVLFSAFILLVLSLGLHEAAHARVASYFGDTTPAAYGVNTWNPVTHIIANFFTCLFIPALAWFGFHFFIGMAVVRLDERFLERNRLAAFAAVGAGPAMNLVLALLFGGISVLIAYLHGSHPVFDLQLSGLPYSETEPLLMVFLIASTFNFLVFAFNLIPIPPLDGASILQALFPGMRPIYKSMGSIAFFVLIAFMWFGNGDYYLFWPNRMFAAALDFTISHVVPASTGH